MAGTSDCELRDDWFLQQDVNAWSSLTYAAIGLVVVAEVARRRLPRAVLALAMLLVAEGLGSLLYHGDASDLAQFLHDVPLIGALAFVAGWHAGRLFEATDVGSLVGAGAGLLASAVFWAVAPSTTNALAGVAVAVIVASSLVARRRHLVAVWSTPLLTLGALGIAAWLLGRPDSPACRPESWFQPHALWHTLTAVVALAWIDRAYAAASPEHPPRVFRRFTDRSIGVVAQALVLAFHRSVDVVGRDRLPADRPVLVVANHGNGFVDPVIVAAVLGRLPRFLAKAALWKVWVARPFLGAAGVLPVYRRADGDETSNNTSVFDACHRELAQGAAVAIFPEGTTGDRAGLDRVKSGAARIALGALPTAPDLVIVPIGLAYESKVETRSRVAVMFGAPIDVAAYIGNGLGADGEPDHADAAALTEQITASLQEVSPGFADVEEREILRAAARAALGAAARHERISFADAEVVARQMARAVDDARARVVDAYRVFATRLQLIGVTEAQLRPDHIPRWRVALSVVGLVVAWSLLVTVTLIHLPAIAVVVVGTGLVRSTATKGTVRLLVGLVSLLATWTVAGIVIADGWWTVVAGIAVAVGGAVALVVWSPLVRRAAELHGRLRVRDRVDLLTPVIDARSRLVDAVAASIGPSHD